MSRSLRAFKRWMRSQGIDCSDALVFSKDNEGISVKAICHLKEGDLVATIPKQSCLTIMTSSAHEMIVEAGLAGFLGLSVALMYEISLGRESVWDGYLQLLPERECVPLMWTSDEVDTLLAGTELHKIVKEDKSLLYEDWKECILPLIASEPFKLDPYSFGVEKYFAARSLISSRSFEIDDFHGSGMVPLADLFNHKTGAENIHFTSISSNSDSEDEEENNEGHFKNGDGSKVMSSAEDDSTVTTGDDPTALEMIVVREVEAGVEVFNTYGSMGNAALLHRYGFTEPDNPFDIVNIDLNLVLQLCSSSFSDRYSRARVSLWRRLSCSGCTSQNSEYFEISFRGEPQLELLILLYILFLPEEAYHKLNCTITSDVSFEKALNFLFLNKKKNLVLPKTEEKTNDMLLTRSVCQALVSVADIRENLYGTNSLEDDLNDLRSCCRFKERKLYHSLVLRVSERRVLEKLRIYASKSWRNGKRKRRGTQKVGGR